MLTCIIQSCVLALEDTYAFALLFALPTPSMQPDPQNSDYLEFILKEDQAGQRQPQPTEAALLE